MATGFQVTFDCSDPAALGSFWAVALGYIEQPPPPGFVSWESFLDHIGVPLEERDNAYAIVDPDGTGPRLYFQRVPEPKTVKNRVHLDVNVGGGGRVPLDERRRRVDVEVDRLVAAERVQRFDRPEQDEYWVVMRDPEGNEFCLQ